MNGSRPDVYDGPVKLGPDAILHMASPQSMIAPAVGGTVNILNSVLKFGLRSLSKYDDVDFLTRLHLSPAVKRVVITSSAAAIIEPKDGPYVFTEVFTLLVVVCASYFLWRIMDLQKDRTIIVPPL